MLLPPVLIEAKRDRAYDDHRRLVGGLDPAEVAAYTLAELVAVSAA